MRRRDFIAGFAGTAIAWPLAAGAQRERVRRIGVLMSGSEDDSQTNIAALREGLQERGWTEGRNVRIDVRFCSNNPNLFLAYAEELVSLNPDVTVASGIRGTRALQQRTQTVPIVFVQVGDPVVSGVVKSIARPEGNTTGTTNLFLSITGKWLQLLKEIAPAVTRVALIFNPEFTGSENFVNSIEAAAPAIPLKAIRTPVHNTTEISSAIEAFAAEPNGGLIVVPPAFARVDRDLINRLAIQHQLPNVGGGLLSYGADPIDLYRRSAYYIDRILHGAKVSDLPVEFPTKFELVVNLKTAKAMGLKISELFLVRADKVIE
jgi:putative tryptophan/tyrosine transport system substrate-binding protein